jgi:hypothetical protein
MTRRGRGGSRGGCSGKHGGRGCGRGQNYTGARMVAKSGLCAALGNNVFDYGHRAAADQMRSNFMGKAHPVCGHKLWTGH